VRNIARSSKFNIRVDFKKSYKSYLYDKNTNRKFLDFFGMYSSLPLGYNHDIFKSKEFLDDYISASSFKINNCEFTSDQSLEFDNKFCKFAGKDVFKYFHYCCTGALAVESAIKTCIDYKGHQSPKVLSFNNSFHGINSYGGFVTSRFPGADARLSGFPELFSVKSDCNIRDVEQKILENKITCVLVEPIQCSAGDLHHSKQFFTKLADICSKHDIPLIFDEIQVGFGSTGNLWYYESLGIVPDIVVFGKKTQLSGIMVQDKMGSIFSPQRSIRLEVTWDADVTDMIRCKYIMDAYEEYNILENVNRQSHKLVQGIKNIKIIKNVRNCGLIVGFDLTNKTERDIVVQELYNKSLLCNPTGDKSIRLRPNLAVTDEEIETAIKILSSVGGGLH